jgi:hypothetical protein
MVIFSISRCELPVSGRIIHAQLSHPISSSTGFFVGLLFDTEEGGDIFL